MKRKRAGARKKLRIKRAIARIIKQVRSSKKRSRRGRCRRKKRSIRGSGVRNHLQSQMRI